MATGSTETKPPKLPAEVTLRAIRYRVQQHEDMVVFSEAAGVFGTYVRMAFDRRCGLWYFRAEASDQAAPVNHILAAYRLLCEAFGGDNCCPRGEHKP